MKKTIRDNLFKILSSTIVRDATGDHRADDDGDDDDDGAASGRALLTALFARAGKGKDEVIQILAREIGNATAAMLREPLSQLAKNQKLTISFEFTPKNAEVRGNLRDRDAETLELPARKPRKTTSAKASPRAAAKKRKTRAAVVDDQDDADDADDGDETDV